MAPWKMGAGRWLECGGKFQEARPDDDVLLLRPSSNPSLATLTASGTERTSTSPHSYFMGVRIIGIDCATEPKKIGLALGEWSEHRLHISEVTIVGDGIDALIAKIGAWVSGYDGPVLIAIDAPLGWPQGMRTALKDHAAGESLVVTDDHAMFRRTTDRAIKTRLGKTPLDVGADRIARTASMALSMLTKFRSSLGVKIPLAWDPTALAKTSAIEVYPAALLAAYQISSKDYKKPKQGVARKALLAAVEKKEGDRLIIGADRELANTNADALDSMLCVLAAAEFLSGNAQAPAGAEQLDMAHLEGWIWSPDKQESEAP